MANICSNEITFEDSDVCWKFVEFMVKEQGWDEDEFMGDPESGQIYMGSRWSPPDSEMEAFIASLPAGEFCTTSIKFSEPGTGLYGYSYYDIEGGVTNEYFDETPVALSTLSFAALLFRLELPDLLALAMNKEHFGDFEDSYGVYVYDAHPELISNILELKTNGGDIKDNNEFIDYIVNSQGCSFSTEILDFYGEGYALSRDDATKAWEQAQEESAKSALDELKTYKW
jgi:hypothetical protein